MNQDQRSFWLESLPPPAGCRFQLLHAGKFVSDSPLCFGGYVCWHLVVAGAGSVTCGDECFPVRRGALFSVIPGRRITYAPAPGTQWELCFLRVEGEAAWELSRKIGLTAEKPVLFRCGDEAFHRFRQIEEMAAAGCRSPENFAAAILQLTTLLDEEPPPPERSGEALCKEALRLMDEPSQKALNVNELADALQVSRGTLFQAFKAQYGLAPGKILRKRRWEKCLQLMIDNPELSLAELRKLSSFGNANTFFRAFRQTAAQTPGEFRRQLLAERRERDEV